MLEQFQSERIKKGNKPATVNRLIAVMCHMFTKAVDWNMMDRGIEGAIKVKMLPEDNKRPRFLSQEECTALINACDPHLKPIVVTALNTGCRKNEVIGLRWDKHIDLRHGFSSPGQNQERRSPRAADTLYLDGSFPGIDTANRYPLCLLRQHDRETLPGRKEKFCHSVQKGRDL